MREVERSAASVEEALEAALDELGITEQEAIIDIVQEPQKGVLGIGSKGAVVRVRARGTTEVASDEQIEIGEKFLAGLVEKLGVKAEIEVTTEDGQQYLDVVATEDPDAMGILIGRRGQTLDALQELTRAAVQRKTAEPCRLMVDVEDYRKRRRQDLVEKAKDAAEEVKETGQRQTLEPMPAFERKIVHDAVAEVGGVESSSEGEDPKRRVVITKRK